jgi:hypothetical protein
MRTKAAKAANVTEDEDEVSEDGKKIFDFKAAYKKVDEELKLAGGIYRINHPVKVDKVIAQVTSKRNLEEPEEQSMVIAPASSSVTVPVQKAEVDELAKQLAELKIANAQLRAELVDGRAPAPMQAQYSIAQRQPWQQQRQLDPALNRNTVSRGCFFCGEDDHAVMRCTIRNRLLQEGKVHLNEKGDLCLGPPGTSNQPIRFMGVADRVAHVRSLIAGMSKESEQHPQQVAPSTGVSSITISAGTEPAGDDLDTDEEEPELYGIAAGRIDKEKISEKAQTAINARVQKERRLPASKAVRKGTYVNKAAALASAQEAMEDSQATVQSIKDAELTDVVPTRNTTAKKTVRFIEGPQKLGTVLRQEPGAERVVDMVLKSPVGGSGVLTVEDVLGSSNEVRQLFFSKKMWNSEQGKAVLTPKTAVSSTGFDSAHDQEKVPTVEEVPLFFAEVAGNCCVGLYDPGAGGNIMSEKLADQWGLRVRPTNEGATAASFSGQKNRILGSVNEVAVHIIDEQGNRVETRATFQVVEQMDAEYDCIFGRPWLRTANAASYYDDEGRTVLRFQDPRSREMISIHPLNEPGVNRDDLNY